MQIISFTSEIIINIFIDKNINILMNNIDFYLEISSNNGLSISLCEPSPK